jgi:DNA-binding SARP family transcriptional activator/tetratricopeptide (TPR) repeat protein
MATFSGTGQASESVGVEFGLLGPLLVRSGGADVPVRRGRQRAVLAVLLLNAGRVVSVERLIDALWGEVPPASADVAVRNYVMRLRRDLAGVKCRVRTHPPGYLVTVDGEELDVSRFESLLRSARTAGESGEWESAAEQAAGALALWRGEPLCDVESDLLAEREVPRLAELRLRAVETRVEADLRLGRHAEVIAELEHLTAAHRLRENMYGQLMLALYQSGRQAEALGVYRRARAVIVDELGIEPGDGLRGLHQRILATNSHRPAPEASPGPETGPAAGLGSEAAAAAGPPVVPRQLPRAVGGFAGRDRELAVLSGLLDRVGKQLPGSVVISAIGGTAGVGKTALAVQWAHQVSGQFPDGQLYVNLRGYDPGPPVKAGAALSGFLRALGLAAEQIPPGTDERAAEFRSLLARRRILIVLDNAREVEQVRPLLPGSSSCLVLVTSRDAMAGLVARDGATRVDLDLLPVGEATQLLRDLIGERAAADPDVTARLAECCCRLPLALRVAAELANARPAEALADLAAELTDRQRRLDLLEAAGDARSAVREVFSWSYRNLGAASARVFRLIGLHPGPDFDDYVTAALAGASLADARVSLSRLARAHLIQPAGRGRYALHDLLRDYARELAAAQESEEQRRAALTRLFDYYVQTAENAASAMSLVESSAYRPVRPQPTTAVPAIADAVEASAWLEAERVSLVAVAVYAADHGWPGHVITLSAVLFRYLEMAFYPNHSRAIHAAARSAAQASGDSTGEAHALNSLSGVHQKMGRFRQAAGYRHEALALSRATGDRNGEARALGNLAVMDGYVGRFQQAAEYLYQALALARETGNRHDEARQLFNLSFVCQRLGRYPEAADHARQSLALSREIGRQDLVAHASDNLAGVYLQVGRYREATGYLRQALELFRGADDLPGEAHVLITLADVDGRAGSYERAVRHVRQGLALCRAIGEQIGEVKALTVYGDVLFAAGRPAEARTQHAAALELSSRTGDLYQQARAHHGLGRAHLELGDPGQARFHWQQALPRYTDMGTPEAKEVGTLLAGLPALVREQR